MADALSRFYLECKDTANSKDLKIFNIIDRINPLLNLPMSDNCIGTGNRGCNIQRLQYSDPKKKYSTLMAKIFHRCVRPH